MRRLGRYVVFPCAALLAAALSNYGAQADVPPVPTGTWTTGDAFGEIPRDAASAVLPDGRLVVSGGSDSEGRPIDLVAIYDPSSGTWQRAGAMSAGRAGHTLTALGDGRLLITGGRTATGLTDSTELYDPATGGSVATGALSLPRAHHAAARLADDRVLIVGGWDGTAAIAMAEVFDSATGSISQLAVSLSTARMKLSATTLLDGHVLVAGGNDGTQDLASAEVFDTRLGTFFPTSPLTAARSAHVAVLLPHNNTVLIAGGTSAGAALTSVERYADWRDRFVPDSGAMTAARTGAVAVPTSRDGVLLVGGGGPAEAELYGFATLKTDKADYAPGEIVTFTGSGWQPGETVRLTVSEDADTHYDFEFTAVADESGNIVNQEFFPREDEIYHHMGMRFYAVARGIASDAQTTFTDGGTLSIAFAGDGSGSVSGSGAGHQPQDFAGCTSGAGSCSLVYNSSGEVTLTATPASGSTFAGWSGECSGAGSCVVKMDKNRSVTATFSKTATKQDQTITFGVLGAKTYGDSDFTVTATASSGLPVAFIAAGQCAISGNSVHISGAGSCTITAQQAGNFEYNAAQDVSRSFTIEQATPVVTVTGGTYTYDGLAHPASAAAAGVNGSSVPGSFSFTYNGAAADPVNAGSYAVVASFTSGDANYKNATGNGTLTIEQATPVVTVTGGTYTYDGLAHPASASAAGVNGSTVPGNFSFTYNGAAADPVNAGSYAVVASFTSTDANYKTATGDGTLTIEQATPVVTVTGGTYTYDGLAHPASASAAGVNGSTVPGNFTFTYNGAATDPVNAGSYAVVASFTSTDANYKTATGDGTLTIEQATPVVTVTGGTYTYDGLAHQASASAVGVNGSSVPGSFTFTYNGAATDPVNAGSYAVVASFTSTDANYKTATDDGTLTIEQATPVVTVTAGAYTYDGLPHPASAAAAGVNGSTVPGSFSFTYNGAAAAPVNAGSFAVAASFTSGDANYKNATGNGSILINKATQTIVVTTPAPAHALYGTSFTVAAAGGGSGNAITFGAAGSCTNVGATFTMTSGYGTCTVTFNQAGNQNYYAADVVNQSVTATPWKITGFYSPVTSSVLGSPVWNLVKGGSTVPLKFEIFAGADGLEQTSLSAVKSLSLQPVNCTVGVALDVPPDQLADTGGTSLRHDGSQFIQNWKTPKLPGSCFVVIMQAADSSTISAYFQIR